jgi:hypothetical protein
VSTYLLFALLLASSSLYAQRIDGTWNRVARKGNDPCAVDMLLVLSPKGGQVDFIYGSQTEGCSEESDSWAGYTVEKEIIETDRGPRKLKVLILTDGEDVLRMPILSMNSDFMKLQAEVTVEGGKELELQELIYKRMR